MMYWIIYLFSLILLIIQNKMVVLVSSQRPVIFRSPGSILFLNLFATIARYGSIFLIYSHYGLVISAISLLLSYLISHVLFKFFFGQQVYRVMPMFYEQVFRKIESDRQMAGISTGFNSENANDPKLLFDKAKAMAEELVISTMKHPSMH